MNRLTVYFSFRLLFSSILLAGFLTSCSVSKKYKTEATGNWEKDIIKFEQQDKSEIDPANAIFFTGSSSIRLWSTLKDDVAPYPVIQRAFGGSKFSDLAVYAKRIVYPHHFRALVIFEANDITGSKTDKSPQEVVALFKDIVKTVREKNADQPIFLFEITPTQSRWAVWPIVKQTNQMLKETCSKLHNTYFIETAAAYLNKDGKPRNELFIKDMLHQNHEGYAIWGDLVKKKLDEVLT
ncbi:MAG TPA: GDSL-type esterase/lipase family protein, partial [Prolixibacteraceae bacterium]